MQREIVAHGASLEAVSDTFRKILVPIDPSRDDARHALHAALELMRRFGSEVRVVTLTEFGENDAFVRGLGADEDDDDLEESALGRLRRFVQNVAPDAADLVSYGAFEDNDLPRGIDRIATSWGATLVVLVSPPHRGVFRARYERIIQALDSPVLLLRPSGAPEP